MSVAYGIVMTGRCVLNSGEHLGFATTRFSTKRDVDDAILDGWASILSELSGQVAEDPVYEESTVYRVGWLKAALTGKPRRGFTFYDLDGEIS